MADKGENNFQTEVNSVAVSTHVYNTKAMSASSPCEVWCFIERKKMKTKQTHNASEGCDIL